MMSIQVDISNRRSQDDALLAPKKKGRRFQVDNRKGKACWPSRHCSRSFQVDISNRRSARRGISARRQGRATVSKSTFPIDVLKAPYSLATPTNFARFPSRYFQSTFSRWLIDGVCNGVRHVSKSIFPIDVLKGWRPLSGGAKAGVSKSIFPIDDRKAVSRRGSSAMMPRFPSRHFQSTIASIVWRSHRRLEWRFPSRHCQSTIARPEARRRALELTRFQVDISNRRSQAVERFTHRRRQAFVSKSTFPIDDRKGLQIRGGIALAIVSKSTFLIDVRKQRARAISYAFLYVSKSIFSIDDRKKRQGQSLRVNGKVSKSIFSIDDLKKRKGERCRSRP